MLSGRQLADEWLDFMLSQGTCGPPSLSLLLNDELLPDLPEPGLRAEVGAHQQHVVDQDAHAADRKKVPAEVIQVVSYEVDTDLVVASIHGYIGVSP